MIAATQRPSVDVLSGKIKVNFPARIGLRLPSAADSKTVFGRAGAEQLLGKGDMFFLNPDMPGLQRLHAPYCREEDISNMIHMSTEIGHVNSCPADGPAPTTPAGEAKKEKEAEPAVPQLSHSLHAFLREKNLTWEQAQNLKPAEKAVLNADFKLWQRVQRNRRQSI